MTFTIGSYLLIICTLLNRNLLDKTELYLLQGVAIALNLVAVVNESYGLAHFTIFAILFIILGAYILYDIAKHRSVMLILLTLISLTLWITHLALSMPKGVAIPELVTILTATVCYIRCIIGYSKYQKSSTGGFVNSQKAPSKLSSNKGITNLK